MNLKMIRSSNRAHIRKFKKRRKKDGCTEAAGNRKQAGEDLACSYRGTNKAEGTLMEKGKDFLEVKTPGIDLAAEGRAWIAPGQIAGP